MKNNNNHILAALALLGLALNASADEAATKPTATVTIAKPATETKAMEPAKPAVQAKPTEPPSKSAASQPTATPQVAATPATIPQPAPKPKTHVVLKGDTLTSIARHNGVSVERLALWNRLADPDKLSIGQRIEIPPPRAMLKTAKSPKVAKPAAAPAKAAETTDPDVIHVTLSSK